MTPAGLLEIIRSEIWELSLLRRRILEFRDSPANGYSWRAISDELSVSVSRARREYTAANAHLMRRGGPIRNAVEDLWKIPVLL